MSSTGNRSRGFTFVEVMVALVVLSAGIVVIYKSFFLCVDYLNNLTTRIYAVHLIDGRIAEITRSLSLSHDAVVAAGPEIEPVSINHREIQFHFDVHVAPVLDAQGLYKLDIDLRWFDGRRQMGMARSAYILK